ncbi:MAG: universal stress protein [Bacteroidota bacterium]
MTPSTPLHREKEPLIELIGIGSAKHRALKKHLLAAMASLDINYPIREVTTLEDLLKYKIGGIPALMIDGKVVFERQVPSIEELRLLFGALIAYKEERKLPVRKLLVPTDFSAAAENAYVFAQTMGKTLQTDLEVIHVEQPTISLVDPLYQKVEQQDTVREAMLNTFVKKKGVQKADVVVERNIVKGAVVDELLQRAQQEDIEMVIMGMTGENDLLKRWIGSISAKVARNAAKPVVLIPPGVPFSGFRRIVYASDYHPDEKQVLPQVLRIARYFGGDIHFLHVDETQSKGAEVKQFSRFPVNGYFFSYTRIGHEDIVTGINDFATLQQADLIVLSTAPRTFLEDIFHRSVSQQLVFKSNIPLMITHLND